MAKRELSLVNLRELQAKISLSTEDYEKAFELLSEAAKRSTMSFEQWSSAFARAYEAHGRPVLEHLENRINLDTEPSTEEDLIRVFGSDI